MLALAGSDSAALAAHGKAGLWNVSTTLNDALSPAAMAQLQKMGATMESRNTIRTQMCMTQAQVDSDTPLHMDKNNAGCTTRVTSMTATGMTSDMVCTGTIKGTGHIAVAYQGAEHYTGTYSFTQTGNDKPDTSYNLKGDWVKADCGAVQPVPDK